MPKPTLTDSIRQFIVPLLPAILGSLASAVNCPREDFSWWRLLRKLTMGLFVGYLMLCMARTCDLSSDKAILATGMAGAFADEFLMLIKRKVTQVLR